MHPLTDHVIEFTLNTRWQELPAAVQHQSKRCLLDTLGALIAGSQTPVAAIMRKTALEQFGGDEATILVSADRVSAAVRPWPTDFMEMPWTSMMGTET